MRIIDHTTGRSFHRVGSDEEALLAITSNHPPGDR